MKTRHVLIPTLLLALPSVLASAAPLGTAFTYQGQLTDRGVPADGMFDLRFALYDEAVGGGPWFLATTNTDVSVSNGVFTATVDFSAEPFDGTARWLEIGVRPSGSTYAFAQLTPRQALTPTPYALYTPQAGAATTATTLAGSLHGDVTGTQHATRVEQLQGYQLSSNTPGKNTVLRWDGSTWTPGPVSLATDVSGTLAVGQGGTGSDTKNFVDLTSDQTVSGGKVFAPSNDVTGVVVRQSADGSPAADVFAVQDATGSQTYFRVDPTGSVSWSGSALGSYRGDGSGLTNLDAENLASGTVPDARLSGVYAGALSFVNPANTFTGTFSGDGSGLTNVGSGDDWQLTGNAFTTPGTHFLGTTDIQPLELRVNNQRALRLEYYATSPNVVGGHELNSVTATKEGATISGGGSTNWYGAAPPHLVAEHFGTVGGGVGNMVRAKVGTIAGGERGLIEQEAHNSSIGGGALNVVQFGAVDSAIAGGRQNVIQTNASHSNIGGGGGNIVEAGANQSSIGGGADNRIGWQAGGSTIGGGQRNLVEPTAYASTIAGGQDHRVAPHADGSSIGGGVNNLIESNAYRSTISGGMVNWISRFADASTIGGGANNVISNNAFRSTIGGGTANTISPSADLSTIGGGGGNVVSNTAYRSTIGGGTDNRVGAFADRSVIGGGTDNRVGDRSWASTIAGGGRNIIEDAAQRSSMGGGEDNAILHGAQMSTVGGGWQNVVESNATAATIGGGQENRVHSDAHYAAIGGGWANAIQQNATNTTISGGFQNVIGETSYGGAIGGGSENQIQPFSQYGTIGGGRENVITTCDSTIGGGFNNIIQDDAYNSTIGGGWQNTIFSIASECTIGGGIWNRIGLRALNGTISGGALNYILDDAQYGTIGGGESNGIQSLAAESTIGGGSFNTIKTNAVGGAIGGGSENRINSDAQYGTIGGGFDNVVGTNSVRSTIGGGYQNKIYPNARQSTVAGGHKNWIFHNAYQSTVAGGNENTVAAESHTATIGGGDNNAIETQAHTTTIGGGSYNTIHSGAEFATIPGGSSARALNHGQWAYANGSFNGEPFTGEAQTSLYVLRQITTTNHPPKELFLDGDSARMTIPEGSTWVFEGMVVARTQDTREATITADSAGYHIEGVIENAGGWTELLASTVRVIDREVTTWRVFLDADNTHDALVIRAEGAEAVPVCWVASVRTTEVMYPE